MVKFWGAGVWTGEYEILSRRVNPARPLLPLGGRRMSPGVILPLDQFLFSGNVYL